MTLRKHFYYYRWYYPGDDELSSGLYHSTVVTTATFKEFVSSISEQRPPAELFVKEFETITDMQIYWEKTQLHTNE